MENIHERVLHLRDVALGLSKAVQVTSSLAPASYDCAVDSLLALYTECNQVASLAKDKHVGRFLEKCKTYTTIPYVLYTGYHLYCKYIYEAHHLVLQTTMLFTLV